MRRILAFSVFFLAFVFLQASAKADDYVVPAGTLLRCTLDEPNFSSATADVGDPVVCHLSGLRQFGRNILPRGSYLGGHLESAKEPGHFWGKGSLKIEFDRIGFPSTDVPVPAKVISAKGYKVGKHGDIKGKGHPTRDVVEWLIPPLWPWKILTLPARGPRPALKGEEQIVVRLMDDIEVPRLTASYRSSDKLADRPPASYHSQSFRKPASFEPQRWAVEESDIKAQPASQISSTNSEIAYIQARGDSPEMLHTLPVSTSEVSVAQNAFELTPLTTVEEQQVPRMTTIEEARPVSEQEANPGRVRLIALKSNTVYAVTKYRINSGSVSYVLASGTTGSLDITEVDWRTTSRLNAEPIASSVTVQGTY